jgi:phage terminase large subunit-like protein
MQRGQRGCPFFVAFGVVQIIVEQTAPTALNANDFNAGICATIDDGFDCWVQPWDVAATGQNTYSHN